VTAARVVIVYGEQPGRAFRIGPSGARLGTSAECELRLRVRGVSRVHARIFKIGDAWLVEDLGSTNGTFVDGVRVTSRELDQGSRISLGECVVLRFIFDRDSGAA
jgi:pSer/pThr/pTyr-binding forkhead associated (FHA) protein